MDEPTFQRLADGALETLNKALIPTAEEFDFDCDFNAGALTIAFDDPPARFVVSPNSPVRQIWVSANVKSYKLDWDQRRSEFVLASTGQNLNELIAEAISTHLGEAITL
ncbi:MAG: iron donor protein CyaY [Bryobacterales bacterium]|nr:iron donor protein CyaY [Bryobacterales bacterium]